jgi:hypothetical protein
MTVIDQILNEWAFRCQDGIVDMNDPEKKAILDEVLKEHGLLKEEETTEDEILNAIVPLNDEEKKKVLGFIKNKFKEEIKDHSELEKKIESKVGNPNTADVISAFAVKSREDDDLLKYLSSNEQLSFDLGKKTGDLLTILKDTKDIKFSENFLSKIIQFTPSEKGKALGIGEIALELFFNNTKKADVGDVIVNGKLVELKGSGARFPSEGVGVGREGKIEKTYSNLKNKYKSINSDQNLASYISDILRTFQTESDLSFINKEIDDVYPGTSNIKITLEDIGSINKKLIKKYIASYVALYNNDYYMLVSKESPFNYTDRKSVV